MRWSAGVRPYYSKRVLFPTFKTETSLVVSLAPPWLLALGHKIGGARVCAGHGQRETGSEFGWALYEDGRWEFTLGIDQTPLGYPCFNRAGTVFIWANRDGTMSDANLDSIRKELSRLGFR